MSIQVYAATTLGPLAKKLASALKAKQNSVFHSDFISLSNSSVGNWLKVQIAEENGIAANLKICSPRELLTIIFKILGGKDEEKSVLTGLQQKWIIYELLSDTTFKSNFPEVSNYYNNKPIYQLALAGKLATRFEQYSLYIPSQLEAWGQTDYVITEADEKWQRFLWTAFQNKIKSEYLDDFQLFQYIKTALKDSEKASVLKEKLPSIHLFNISDFNTNFLELFLEIGKSIDVDLFFESTISEVKETYTNPLVNNLKGAAPYILEVFKRNSIEVDWLKEQEALTKSSMLHVLQESLLEDKLLAKVPVPDSSININSSYSSIREVEILYNYLVKSVDASQSTLGARDIVVYCSDLEKYAPAISAVFENAPYRFPYHIVGEKEKVVHSSLRALETMLQIDVKWMKPSVIMQLLEYPSIVQKYQIEDVALLRELVREANIRNGFVGEKENETHLISWQNGLKRLSYGMLISGEGWFEVGDESYLVIDKVEGSTAHDLVRFNYFIQNIHKFLSGLTEDKTLAEWVSFIQDGCDMFFDRENDYQLEHLTLELAKVDLVASADFKIAFETISPILQDILGSLDDSKLVVNNRGIRFCSMANAQPIPKAIVALLGLNGTDFPRKQNSLSYDLIKSNSEAILQDVKEKDKAFFLKAILSAKQQLYLSYIGKSSKNNAVLAPSVLIDGLVDYLSIENLIIEHPLHNFNSKYFKGDADYYSYLGKNKDDEMEDPVFDEEKNTVEDKRKVIVVPLHEFINFFKDSFKYRYNKDLKVYYREEAETLEDSELFDLDTLQSWAIKKEIVEASEITAMHITNLKAQGKLPLATYGELCFENLQKEFKPLTDKISELKAGFTQEKTKISCELEHGGVLYKIKGHIDSVFVNGNDRMLIYPNVSSSQLKYQFEAFVQFLILNKERLTKLEFLGVNKKKLLINTIDYSEEYQDVLNELFRIFMTSKSKFQPFYINDYIVEEIEKLDIDTTSDDTFSEADMVTVLSADSYLSNYVDKEIASGYFKHEANRLLFVENNQLLNQLIFKNF